MARGAEPSRARRWAGRALLALGALLVALLLGEGALRLSIALEDAPGGDDDWYVRYRRMNETLYQRSEVPGLIYEPSPGVSVEMEYGAASFNEAGMRDDREHAREPDGRTRVAVLGDSLVWSEFLPIHDSIPLRVREALGEGYEVLPFGVSGYDVPQEALWYAHAVRSFEPSVVVVVWCMNDLMIMSGPFERFATDREHERKDRQEALMERVAPERRETIDSLIERDEEQATSRLLARLYGLWRRWRFDARYVDEYLVAFDDAPSRERAEAGIARLGRELREDGVRAIFVISPVLESWDEYHWAPIHDWVRERAEQAGFEVIDPLERWRGTQSPEDLRISGDNLHYDQSGARVMASVIADAVRER